MTIKLNYQEFLNAHNESASTLLPKTKALLEKIQAQENEINQLEDGLVQLNKDYEAADDDTKIKLKEHIDKVNGVLTDWYSEIQGWDKELCPKIKNNKTYIANSLSMQQARDAKKAAGKTAPVVVNQTPAPVVNNEPVTVVVPASVTVSDDGNGQNGNSNTPIEEEKKTGWGWIVGGALTILGIVWGVSVARDK